MYGGLLPKDYGTRSIDAQRCANTLRPLNQVFSFRKESKTTTFTKSKPCNHVLSCLFTFVAESSPEGKSKFCIISNCCVIHFSWVFLFDRALYAIAFSVLDIGAIYLWPWV